MSRKHIARSAALACILSLLLAFASCVEKPQTDTSGNWEGKEDFKVEDKFDEELVKRYDEYKENVSLAFTANTPEDESHFATESYGDGVKITGFSGDSTIIVVPDTIGGKAVLAIGAKAFSGKNIRAVSLPDSVESIEKGAFAGCDKLSTLRLPFVGDGGENDFLGYIFGASKYEEQSLKVPASLDMVILGDKTAKISDNAFAGCKSISAVVLPKNVESIGAFAFYECKDLVYADIGAVREIGEYAFGHCSSLLSLTVDSAEKIGRGALFDCSSLRALTLSFVGESKTENRFIGHIFGAESADFNDEFVPASLRTVNLNCEEIPHRAFALCAYIMNVNLSESVEKIGVRAFYGCRSIQNIAIPDGVKTVGDDAFFGCDNLESVSFGSGTESIGMQAFYGCRALKAVVIPEKVTEIKPSTFALCSALESVELNNVKRIGKDAFWKCEALTPVDCAGIEVADGNGSIVANVNE